MKRFLLNTGLFLLPILMLLVILELYVRNSQNSFMSIADYFKQNTGQIEVLILGSSHSQNGLNPKFFDKMTANISYGSQDIKIDSALFFHNAAKLKKLKVVIFELDYHRMDIENEPDFYRFPWYYLYYGIEVAPIKWYNKLSLYSSNTEFFNNIIIKKFKEWNPDQIINKYGYVEANYNNQFQSMGYDSLQIAASAKERLMNRHKENFQTLFQSNKRRIESMIRYCDDHNIRIYFFSSPLYKTYIDNKIKAKDDKMKTLISELQSKYHIRYYDFQTDKRFSLKDFRDDDHLNSSGAEKYSRILNSIINQ